MKNRSLSCCLLAASIAVPAFAGITYTSAPSSGATVGDDLANLLRNVPATSWDLNDGYFSGLGIGDTILKASDGFIVDWVRVADPLSFSVDIVAWGISSEAGLNDTFLATDDGGLTSEDIFTRGDPGWNSDTYFISSGLGNPITVGAKDPDDNAAEYGAPTVIFAAATYQNVDYYMVFFDDLNPQLNNHDDLTVMVRAVPEPSLLLGALTTGVLGLIFIRRRR